MSAVRGTGRDAATEHEEDTQGMQGTAEMQGMEGMAASATLHCLAGCATGEIVGLSLGTALGWGNLLTIPVSVALAFVFGFSLSSLPLLRSGVALLAALQTVALADTLSIATMELVDNLVVLAVPGALEAGLANPTMWWSMGLAFLAAYAVAYPVNRALMRRGKGHAISHGAAGDQVERPWIPDIPAPALAWVLAAFLAGALLVSVAS